MKSQVQIITIISLFLFIGSDPVGEAADFRTTLTSVLGSDESATVKRFWVDCYSFQLNEQRNKVLIELTSQDFDTYLIVIPPNGQPLIDDDSGDKQNSQLSLTNLATGTWRVFVTSYSPGKRGRYTLTVIPPEKFAKDSKYAISSNVLSKILDRRKLQNVVESAVPTSYRECGVPTGYREYQRHSLPWPPPQASATAAIPTRLFFSDSQMNARVLLSDVDRLLTKALRTAGYTEYSYYRIPDGFALVTRIEQINDDGTPLDSSARWSIDISPLNSFSLLEYIRALFSARSGYFRVIVFTVTSNPFIQSENRVRRSEVIAWLRSGFNILPHEVGELLYTQRYHVTALIYEFEKPRAAQNAEFLEPGRMDGISHLRQAGIFPALGR